MRTPRRSYEELSRLFRWQMPASYNFVLDAVDQRVQNGADGHRTALVVEDGAGVVSRQTFLDLALYSNRLAHLLAARGIGPGAAVAILAAPSAAAAIALLGVLKTGAAAALFPTGAQPSADILAARNVKAVIGDQHSSATVVRIVRDLPGLNLALTAHAATGETDEFWTSLIGGNDDFLPSRTRPADPALWLHDGPDEAAALYPHSALKARAFAAAYLYQGFPHVGDVTWSASDWVAGQGWIDAVLPAWYHGVPVVAAAPDHDSLPGLLSRQGVRVLHLPARNMERLRAVLDGRGPPLRSLLLAGRPEPGIQAELTQRFGPAVIPACAPPPFGPLLTPAPFLGFDTPVGAWGRPPPGYGLDVVDIEGRILPADTVGLLALPADSPILPLATPGWDLPIQTGSWQPLPVRAFRDLDGNFWPETPLTPPPSRPKPPPYRRPELKAPRPEDRWRKD